MYAPRKLEKRPGYPFSRRRFVQGALASSAIAAFELWRWPSLAAQSAVQPSLLSGNRFDLVIEDTPINFTGRPAIATTVNGLVPGPTLRWREGDEVTISVTNRLGYDTSIHWHGIRVPADMDGVPGLSFPGIHPSETFVYRFPVRQSGTYWYHSHSRFQEQTGHYGPLIIDPGGNDPIRYERDYVIMLSDWTDEDPRTVLSNLKQQSDYYNYHQRTVGTFLSDVRKKGLGATISNRLMWGRMNMAPTDLSDVSGAVYKYLINGQLPVANWTALFCPGERVRLRFINGSSMTIFDVRIPNLPMTVVQTDGNDVEPVTVDEFRISVAETYDVIVHPESSSAFIIFAQALDRTGYALATLAPKNGMSAPIPPMDPRPQLTMIDMGMGSMPGMEMNTPQMGVNAGGAGNQSTSTNMANMSGMNIGDTGMKMGSPSPTPPASPGMNLSNMPGIEMATPGPLASPRPTLSGAALPPAQPGPGVSPSIPSPGSAPGAIPRKLVEVAEGPQVDNVAMMPTERLNEPGVGLDNNGRRVLTYTDLRARYRGADPRPAEREIELHLTGNMERFIWGFDGKKFSAAEPIRLKFGERVRFILVNDSMMNHPIHLHGLWSELENGQGEFRPYKHTINVKPGERLSYLVSADTPGRWAYHCHLLYHMESGMFREVIVS
jgi:CopA family copper-resistance protein